MSGKRGSNSRPPAWEASALPTELLPHLSRYPDSNRGPTHYECVALPTEPYRQKRMQRYIQKRRNQNICRYFYLLLKQYSV